MSTKRRVQHPDVAEPPPETWSNCLVVGARAGQAVDQVLTALAATGHRHGLSERDSLASVTTSFRIHLDQPKQQLQGPVPVCIWSLEQGVGIVAEDAGESALIGEQLSTQAAVRALFPQPMERVLD